MGENKSNPFAALFGSVNQAEQVIQPSAAEVKKEDNFTIKLESNEPLECLAREVFFITCQSASKSPLVFLEDVASALGPEAKLDITLLGEALFERLLLNQPENYVRPKGIRVPSHVIEEKVITYLFESWRRLQNCNKNSYRYTYNTVQVV